MQDIMSVTPLGSGQEVGRSCHILEFRGIRVMLDIGIHPGLEGLNGLPFLDRVELDQIDVLLVTHFHLDHAASLPYLTEKTNFKGRIFMTHPTKAVLTLLLGDYLRLMQMRGASDALYNEADLNSCMKKIELIDYHQSRSVMGMSFHALNAGHVLGACMYWIEIGGRTVLYTGDYSMEEDRHLMAAEIPDKSPDLLIVESTYGIQVHRTRKEREAQFTGEIEQIVSRGGRCLIPVFALGRAQVRCLLLGLCSMLTNLDRQELLLILDEYWQANPHLHNIPIWYASRLATKALRVYQTYSNMMNMRIRAQMNASNPFHFEFIKKLKSIDENSFNDSGPSVVFASPGMLQSGVSRQLFDRWASDKQNGVMIAGYAVEHTLAKEIMSAPTEVVTLEGRRQPLKCSVSYVSFSAHVDFVQNRSFIHQVKPKHIVLVHGQKDEMGRLKRSLTFSYQALPENQRPTISMPPNEIDVKVKFARRRYAKVMGSLAEKPPVKGESVQGVMVTHNFQSKIVAPEDLSTYTPLHVGSITSTLHVPFAGSTETLRLFLNEMFQGVREEQSESESTFRLHGGQIVIQTGSNSKATVKWEASPAGDSIADSVVALIMHAQSSSASIRLTSQPCRRAHHQVTEDEPFAKRVKKESGGDLVDSRLKLLYGVLRQQFLNVDAIYEGLNATFEIETDVGLSKDVLNEEGKLMCSVRVSFIDETATAAQISVESRDTKLAKNVEELLQNAVKAATAVDTDPP